MIVCFFSPGFGETRGVLAGEVSREFQCNDQQDSVSEVQACLRTLSRICRVRLPSS